MKEALINHLQSAALSTLGFAGIISNGLVFLLLYRKHSMRTLSNRFVLSLAASHMMQCIFIIPAMVASIYGWSLNSTWCHLLTSSTVFLNLVSVLSIVLIAIDRNCAVNSPLHYTITITKKRTGLLITAAWLLAMVLALPPLLVEMPSSEDICHLQSSITFTDVTVSVAYGIVIAFIGFIAPFSSVTVLYFAMFQAARDNYARTTRRSSSYSSGSNEIIVNVRTGKTDDHGLRRNYSADHEEPKSSGCCFAGKHKAAVTGLLVVVSFVTCWLPFFMSLMSDLYVPMPAPFKFCVKFATFTSCVINPYLYFFRNKNTWTQTKKMVVCLVTRRKENIYKGGRGGKKSTVELSSGVSQLPEALTQSVLAMNTSHLNSLCPASTVVNVHKQPYAYPEKRSSSKGNDVFSLDPAKPLLHQDSSSSNDSNDAFAPGMGMDSVIAPNAESFIWYHPFHGSAGMVDVPLHPSNNSNNDIIPSLVSGHHQIVHS